MEKQGRLFYGRFIAAHSLRKIDDVFSLRNIISEQINKFIELANNNLPTKKFDSRLKLQIQKLSWIHVYGGEISTIESILNTCAYFKPTRNLSNARTSPPATLQASGKALSKTKPYGFWERTLQKLQLKKTLHSTQFSQYTLRN